MTTMTFEEFRNSGMTVYGDLHEKMGLSEDECSTTGRIYGDEFTRCYIEWNDNLGEYTLFISNTEWSRPTDRLIELERILYDEFYIHAAE